MATIEKRTAEDGTLTYRVKVRIKGYPSATATFPRLTDAKRWAAQTETAIRERRFFHTREAQRHTVRDLIERYRREVLPTKAPGTQKRQQTNLKWWLAEIGDTPLAEVTPALIVEQREKLLRRDGRRGKTADPASVRHALVVLSHAFQVAMREWGWVEDNPLTRVKKPEVPRGRVRFLSDDERERLLQACKESREPLLYLVVIVALATGMRSSEIRGLTWDRVDLRTGRIVLEDTKNGERRTVPLVGRALEVLKEHGKVRRLDTPLLFPRPRDPQRPIRLDHAWAQAVEAAGIQNFRFHDLRHSAASYMLMNGATLGELAEVLGHKTLAMVKRYSHLSEPHTRGLLERMNAAVFGGQ